MTDRLNPGEQLNPGGFLWSADPGFALTMQFDGNLVLYAPGNWPIWNSGTDKPGSVAVMQADGNLVILAPGTIPVWNSGSSSPGSVAIIQTDGNFVIYAPGNQPVWNTETRQPDFPFTFDPAITAAQVTTLLERHRYGFGRMMMCQNITNAERQTLQQAYNRPIAHGINTNPNQNASATVGGNQLDVNFNNLFPKGPTEIAQTLIHEMMHCAGFTHPTRRDPPAGTSCSTPNPALFDCPFDNGVYYGSPPLRAELCIAGSQSDLMLRVLKNQGDESCTIDAQNTATINCT